MADSISPTKDRILVRPYQKPARYGEHIILPDPYRDDNSGTLWEFIKGGPDYALDLGAELKAGDILQTNQRQAGIYLDNGLWMITASQVQVVHAWVSGGDDAEE